MESKPNAALKELLSEICRKYLAAQSAYRASETTYEMGRAHGALMLMTRLGEDNSEGWDQWNKAFDGAIVDEALQERGVPSA